MAQKFVAPNTIFDSSVAFLKQVSLDSTVIFDSVPLTTVDTSAEGLSQLDTALATSGAIKTYVDNKVVSGVGAWNGLSETDTSIGLGGLLVQDTIIGDSSGGTFIGEYDFTIGDQIKNLSLNADQNIEIITAGGLLQLSGGNGVNLSGSGGGVTALGTFIKLTGGAGGVNIYAGQTDADVSIHSTGPNGAVYIDGSILAIESNIITFDSVNILNIDTSAEGLSQLDTAIATSGAIRAYVDNAAGGKDEFNELLDVSVASRANNDLTAYNSTTLTWDNRSLASLDIATLTYVDGSLAARDTSIANLVTITTNLDTSISNLDTLTQSHTADIAQLDASVVRIDAYNVIQDASILIALGGTTGAWNGLTETDNSIGLGGTLDLATTITTTATETLTIAGLQVSIDNTPEALVMDTVGGVLKYRQLGTMAWETATDYTTQALFDSSLLAIDAYQVIQDGSIAAIETAQGNYVLKTGDTMTGPLTITGGGLQVGTVGTPQDVSIYSQLYVHNGATIGGDLIIDGSLFVRSVETIDVSGAFIQLNTGQTGIPPASMQSGIVIDRGDEIPYVFLYDESTQDFRIGIAPVAAGPSYDDASTQAVATREDTPILNGIGYWNSTLSRIDTDASITFSTTSGLTLGGPAITVNGLAADGAELTGILINGSNELVTREFGTGAFANIGDFATLTYVDGSLAARDTSIANLVTITTNLDTSIGDLDTLTQTHTADIAQLDASVVRIDAYNVIQDGSISALETSITDLSTGKIDAVATTGGAGGHEVYSNEADNVAYIKRLVAGTGATILSDSSTITISVSGAAGYMSKYTDTFSADGSTSFTVTQATHGISNTDFALSVAVFEGTVQVFPEIDVDAGGDVTITWSSGALTGTGKFIISG